MDETRQCLALSLIKTISDNTIVDVMSVTGDSVFHGSAKAFKEYCANLDTEITLLRTIPQAEKDNVWLELRVYIKEQ